MTPIELQVGELRAHTEHDGTTMTLHLVGTADAAAESGLSELLGRVHSAAHGLGEVAVNLRELEFMNSSCFKSLITWIVAVRRSPPENHYNIRFVSNANLHWQKRSLHAISHFGGNLVTVDST